MKSFSRLPLLFGETPAPGSLGDVFLPRDALPDFSDTWQLIINTGTTIVTFLVVFLIQNTQNRDSKALQAKLNELIKSSRRADDALLGADELDDAELDRLCNHYMVLAERRGRRSGAARAKSSDDADP